MTKISTLSIGADDLSVQNSLCEAISEPIQRGIEWMKDGVATCHWGVGYGSSVLDRAVKVTAREYFHLVAHGPADQQLLLIMLAARGLASAGRACANRMGLRLVQAQSQWYATEDALTSYGSPVPEYCETEGRGITSAAGEAFH